MLDYRGYGKSEGHIGSQKQVYNDMQKAYDYVKTRYDESKIIRHVKMLAVVHAHANEKFCISIILKFPVEVVILQQQPDRSVSVLGKNIFRRRNVY